MTEFVQYLATGLALGCTFALVASGIVFIARVTGIVNFSQGIFSVLGGLTAASVVGAGLPMAVAVVVSLIVSVVVGVIAAVVIMGRRSTGHDSSMIISLGFGILLYAPMVMIWGDQPVSLRGLSGTFSLGGVTLSYQYLLIIGVTLLVFAAIALFFSKTYLGKALTASASNPESAEVLGIKVRRMGVIAFVIASMLGAVAGILLMPIQPMAFNSDVSLVLNGFAAAVFGQLTRPGRAFAGAMILGVAQSLTAGYLSAAYQLPVALVILILVLVWQSRRKVLVA